VSQLDIFAMQERREREAREQAAKEKALEQVEENADPDWIKRARLTGARIAAELEELTADDFWEAGLEKPREARALGPVLLRLARAGLIEKTERFRRSRQVGCHGMDVRVWKSLVYGGRASNTERYP
jgi:hypothetical protein